MAIYSHILYNLHTTSPLLSFVQFGSLHARVLLPASLRAMHDAAVKRDFLFFFSCCPFFTSAQRKTGELLSKEHSKMGIQLFVVTTIGDVDKEN